MGATQSAVGNGQAKSYLALTPAEIAALPINEQLSALAESRDENERLRKQLAAKDQPAGAAEYKFMAPSADYPKPTLKLTIGGSKAIMGQRKKFLGLIDEVKSGRFEQWLETHPELT